MKKQGLLRKEGKLHLDELSYQESQYDSLYAYGAPITLNGAKGLIKNYWEAIREKQPIDYSQVPALTFGKEALLSILAQKNCEGIRFYFAMKSDSDWGEAPDKKPDYWYNGVTLVAIGVENQIVEEDGKSTLVEKEIGTPNLFLAEELEKVSDDNSKSANQGVIVETVPPGPGPHVTGKENPLVKLFKNYLKK